MDGVDVDRVDDIERRVLGVGPVATDQLETVDIGVEERVGAPLANGARLRTMNLRDVEEHRTSLCRCWVYGPPSWPVGAPPVTRLHPSASNCRPAQQPALPMARKVTAR